MSIGRVLGANVQAAQTRIPSCAVRRPDYQTEIVDCGALPVLAKLTKSRSKELQIKAARALGTVQGKNESECCGSAACEGAGAVILSILATALCCAAKIALRVVAYG